MNSEIEKAKKLPPIEKIAEAWSVIADNRIDKIDDATYVITSSNGAKQYKVTIKGDRYRSDDSATKFARYAGYPILAVLMYQQALPVPNAALLSFLKGIDWNALNKKHKRNYSEALDEALTTKGATVAEIDRIKSEMQQCYDRFVTLDISV